MGQNNIPCIHQMLYPHLRVCHYCADPRILPGVFQSNTPCIHRTLYPNLRACRYCADPRILLGACQNNTPCIHQMLYPHLRVCHYCTDPRILPRAFQNNIPCIHQMLYPHLHVCQYCANPHILLGVSQSNTPCIHQMLYPHLRLCHYCADPRILPGENAFGNTADRRTFYESQYNGLQNYHNFPNFGLSDAGPSNFYSSSRFQPSFSSNFPASQSNWSSYHLPPTDYMNEFGINSRYVGSIREFGKIKNEEIPLRSFNSSSSFLPLHRGLPQWESSYLQGTLSDYRNFEYPEYQERGYIRTEEEYHRYLRMTLDWQLWLSWNYNRAITDLHDFNPTSQHNLHQPLSLAQTMQLPYYGRQLQIQAPYFQHSLDTSNLFGLNPVSLSSSSTFPHLLLNAEHIIRDYWEQNAAPNFSHAGGRILPLEDAELMNVREPHGVENTIDPFEDMRLDTDGMAYEDLLALGEEIGNVNTGLAEESITKNLKTSLYNSQTEYLPPNQCMICQEELKENEIIGILDCGHNYHEKCIKEWLLNKNLCPICKETALARDNSEG